MINRETVLRLAKEAGVQEPYPVANAQIERFANLIAAEQREIDARLCETFTHPLVCLTIDGRARLAIAIRGQK